ncbi:hypothetical protein [Amycolatopsis sp. TNS106]|uniref:hypothetical protein n=1 Tax=Amycolatopsis sp. TNS106 TaxID=2861750 RepID=UPI001C590153|nr:hypothetical protein [Amycolatopsis sp. TNS106]QXV63590.1 hypothetical protein CVV72_41260 [Amycolatopsis sp. TNS106]
MIISSDAETIAGKAGIPDNIAQAVVNDLGYLLNDGATTVDEAEAFLEGHYNGQVPASVRWDVVVDCYIRNQRSTPENLL